jgi:hypothetical protein
VPEDQERDRPEPEPEAGQRDTMPEREPGLTPPEPETLPEERDINSPQPEPERL